jgi:hypothetical protein
VPDRRQIRTSGRAHEVAAGFGSRMRGWVSPQIGDRLAILINDDHVERIQRSPDHQAVAVRMDLDLAWTCTGHGDRQLFAGGDDAVCALGLEVDPPVSGILRHAHDEYCGMPHRLNLIIAHHVTVRRRSIARLIGSAGSNDVDTLVRRL